MAPTLARDDDAPTSAAASTMRRAHDANNNNNSANTTSSRSTMLSSHDKTTPPAPPPHVPEIQLKMWLAIIQRRKRQLKQLSSTTSSSYLVSFANDIITDVVSSRYETNEYTKDLNNGNKENSQQDGAKMDLLAAGSHYSSFLLVQQLPQQQEQHQPVVSSLCNDIALHLVALFYRSVDERLPSAMRIHGLNAVRRAFKRLDYWLSMMKKEGDDDEKKKDGSGGDLEHGANDKGNDDTRGDALGGTKRKRMDNVGNNVQKEKDGGNKKSKTQDSELKEAATEGDNGSDMSISSSDNSPVKSTRRKDPPIPPQPQQGKGVTASITQTGGKDVQRGTSPLRGSTDQIEKERANERSSTQRPAAAAAAQHQASAVVSRKRPPEEMMGAFSSQQMQKVSEKGGGCQHQSPRGKRFLPPKPQQKPNNSIDNRSNGISTTATVPQKFDRDKGSLPKPATQSLGTDLVNPLQQTREINTLNAPVRSASSTGSGMGRGKAFLPNQPKQRATQISLDSEKIDQPKLLAQRKNPPSQQAASTSVSQAIDDNAFSMQKKSSNSNMSAVNDTYATGSSAKTSASTSPSKSSISPTTNKDSIDNDNAPDVYQKVASRVKEAKRQLAESQGQNKSLPASSNTEDAARKAPKMLVDVIDLTEDSPSHESPSDDDVPSVGSAPSTQAIKQQNDDESVPPQPPSPPASPIPLPTVHSPPASARPNPKPFTLNRNLLFLEDSNPVHTSGCLDPRPSCTVAFDTGYHLDGSGSCLDDAHRINVNERLKTWEPYWKIVEELGARKVHAQGGQMTTVGAVTTSCSPETYCKSCTAILIDLPGEVSQSKLSNYDSSGKKLPDNYRPWGVKWGKRSHPYQERNITKDRYMTGDRRLIVRALPLQRSAKDIKTQSDGHLWPKGSFLQLKRGRNVKEKVLPIKQRKQQSHDRNKWTSQCKPLDLTFEIVSTNVPIELQLCCQEIIDVDQSGKLKGSFALHVAICEYVAADDLYNQLMGNKPGDVIIPRISLRSAKKMAKEFMSKQIVSMIDSDDDDGSNAGNDQRMSKVDERQSLTLSLLCSASRTVMQTPVRGRNCKHMQCFDLKNFLHANENVTGGRWRCLVCESFVSVRDLVHCGLFQTMLDTVGSQVSSARDKVSWRTDGSWKLLEENKLRYSTKRKTATSSTAAKDDDVIELL